MSVFSAAVIQQGGIITPPQITVNENNYNPTGLSTSGLLRLDASAGIDITGIVAQPANISITIVNIGTSDIKLVNESGSSVVANRFALNADIILKQNQSAIIWYDGTSTRWRALALQDN